MKKVGFVSLGCPKNLVDSEVMMGTLAEAGYEITNNADEAETVVVNTCGFIESAKQESIDAILEATSLKSEGSAKRVVVAGCLVERYRDDLMKELPEVDAFIGTSQVGEILKAADETFDAKELAITPIGNKTATYLYDFDTPRFRATDSHTAFIKIAEQLGVDFRLLKEVQAINEAQMDRFVKKILETLWVLKDKRIAVLGLAFKQNTDDVRMSPAIELCQRLLKEGASLRVHDPKAMEKAKAVLPPCDRVTYVEQMDDAADGCDALVIATEWPRFARMDLQKLRQQLSHPIVFDGRNLFTPDQMKQSGFSYYSIGRN